MAQPLWEITYGNLDAKSFGDASQEILNLIPCFHRGAKYLISVVETVVIPARWPGLASWSLQLTHPKLAYGNWIRSRLARD
jgi:hypothetical protein